MRLDLNHALHRCRDVCMCGICSQLDGNNPHVSAGRHRRLLLLCWVSQCDTLLYERQTYRPSAHWGLHPGTCQDVGTVGCQLNDIPAARHTVWSIAYRCRAQNNWQTLMTINCNNYTKLTTITLSSHQLRAAVSYDIMSTGSRAFLVLLRC